MTSNKYHVNPETGNPNKCTAKIKCRFGDLIKDHYDNQIDASKAYEVKSAAVMERYEAANKVNKDVTAKRIAIKKKLDALILEIETAEEPERSQLIDQLGIVEENFRVATDASRNSGYDFRLARKEAQNMKLVEKKPWVPRVSNAVATGTAPKPIPKTNFAEQNDRTDSDVSRELVAWGSFNSLGEAKQALANYDENSGLTRDQYVVSLFQRGLNTPRQMAFVDLETTGLSPEGGEIIEIGIVVMDEKGNIVREINERYDMQREDVRDTLGTGPVEVHNIEREHIAGKRKFTDPESQREVAEILNDRSLAICAHNAPFEKRWLGHYLEGFDDVRNPNSAHNLRTKSDPAPVQDTQVISKMLLHATDDNKLESFSQANGVPYVDAHNGFEDALMTAKAYHAFRSNFSKTTPGQRPVLAVTN